jgi:hypothetical protein
VHGEIRVRLYFRDDGAMRRMTETMDPEWMWNRLLSEEPELIRAAWNALTDGERKRLLHHLRAMAEEEGWQPGQRRAARAALRVLAPRAERKAETASKSGRLRRKKPAKEKPCR